jgi:hypothetical protein
VFLSFFRSLLFSYREIGEKICRFSFSSKFSILLKEYSCLILLIEFDTLLFTLFDYLAKAISRVFIFKELFLLFSIE